MSLNILHVGNQRGHGRMGPRYRVLDESGRPLLVEKIANKNTTDNHAAIEQRVLRLKGLPHDNIVRLYGASRTSEHLEIYTEMTSDTSVQDLLHNMGQLDVLVVRNYARQLLSGLRHLHDHLIYMGGLKHEDVLLAGRGKVKLSNVHAAGLECDVHGEEARSKLAQHDLTTLGIILRDLLLMTTSDITVLKTEAGVVSSITTSTTGATLSTVGAVEGGQQQRGADASSFLSLCETSSSASELLAHAFCGPLPNWRELRRRVSPTHQPPAGGAHTGRRSPSFANGGAGGGGSAGAGIFTARRAPPSYPPGTARSNPGGGIGGGGKGGGSGGSRGGSSTGRRTGRRTNTSRLPPTPRGAPPTQLTGRTPGTARTARNRPPPPEGPPTGRQREAQQSKQQQLTGQQSTSRSLASKKPLMPLGSLVPTATITVEKQKNVAKDAEKGKEKNMEGTAATKPMDAVSAATAKHRAAIGLSAVTKRTPAQKGFLAALAASPLNAAVNKKSLKEEEPSRSDYRKKKASNIAVMDERRRISHLISNVEQLDRELTNSPVGFVPQLRMSALPPRPVLRSYNLLDDTTISSSDDDDTDDEYVHTYWGGEDD